MRVFSTRLSWIYESDKEKRAVKINERKERLKAAGVVLSPDSEDEDEKRFDHPFLSLTETQYVDLVVMGEKFDPINSVVEFGSVETAADKIATLAAKIEKFADKVGNAQFNEKVEVYTPGMGLMMFNRVMLLQDACSDVLQVEMDAGWRIIAACPQPDQRRPDYIMGRFVPDDPGAERSALRGSASV